MDEKKNNKGLKIAVAVMAVVIVALAGVVTAFLLKGDNNDRETSSAVLRPKLKPSRRLLKRRPKPGQPRLLPLFISVRRKPSAFQWAAKKAI